MRFLFLTTLLSISAMVSAQIFPIQVNPQLVPPYSPYLSDYTAPGAQNLMVHIRANDFSLSNYACKLRVTIEGVGITIRTKPEQITRPLMLEGGGIPQVLYGEDLVEYFHPSALDFSGLSRSAYEKSARLPEGVYRFTVEVLDFNRGTVVSNAGSTMAWIILNDPPMLNFPANGATVKIQDPTNILFSWTPRHSGSPNAAFTTEYTLRLVEVWPENRNPYDALLAQHPLFEITTTQPQFRYSVSEPALIPGRKYAWQIEARDAGGKDLFKNRGRSDVFMFQYGMTLATPANFALRWAKPTTLSVQWDPVVIEGEEVKYRLQYRPRLRRENHQWYETRTQFTEKTLYQLEPHTEYEMKVRTELTAQESAYSDISVFKTLSPSNEPFVCKDPIAPPPSPANTTPLFPLSVNDTLHAGGYHILVRHVMEIDGKYFGSGMAIVPWLNSAKVSVTFENIRVNDRFWLTSGTVKTRWNADSKFLIEEETPMLPGQAPQTGSMDITVVSADSLISIEGAAIASVTKDETGSIVVTTTDGKQQTYAPGESYAIVDDVGNGYVVDQQGNIAKTTATEARATAARGDRNYDVVLQFFRGASRFGFDEKQHDALAHYYQHLAQGSYVPWKALSSASPDAVEGKLLSNEVDIRRVTFQAGGIPVVAVRASPQTLSLNLQGRMAGVEEELIASSGATDTVPGTVVGKLNLTTYNPLYLNVRIVPVNGAFPPHGVDVHTITAGLNRIYNQAVVEWRVNVEERITVDLPSGFDDGETGLFSNYTDDMKKVLNAYGRLQSDTYYLFLIAQARDPASLGYMPRNRRAGFVFVESHQGNTREFLKTIAHELGHGAFNLNHTFKEYNLPPGTTDNLMDYSTGTSLYKYQWDCIHEPQRVVRLFEDEADGGSVVVTNMAQLKDFANEDGSYTFLAPTGIPLTLPADIQGIRFWTYDSYPDGVIAADDAPDGALISFTLDDQTYWYHKVEGELTGSGYKVQAGSLPYVDGLSKKQQKVKHAIIGLPCVAGAELKFIARQIVFSSAFPREDHTAHGRVVATLPVENPYGLDYSTRKIYLDAELDFTYSDEARDFISENEACLNEMVYYVIKAADVIQQHPGYYTLYQTCSQYPLRYPDGGNTPTEKAWLLGQYYEKLKGFADELLGYVHQAQYTHETLLNIEDPDALGDLLKHTCEPDFKLFSFEERQHIIKVLLKGKLHDYWFGVGNNRENLVVYTLRQTPEDQYEEMLDLLEKNRYAILKDLVIRCDNQLMGQDNFDKLVDAVTVMIQKTAVYERFEDDIKDNRILRWGGNGYFQSFQYECPDWVDDPERESIAFTYHSYSPYFKPDGHFPSTESLTYDPEYHTLEAAPFDFVVLRLYSDAALENGTPILRRSVSEFQAIPALYLYWMIHRKATDQTLTHMKAGVNLLLFAAGGAEIMAARSTLRLALAITDQTLFATSFVLEAGPRRLLEEGPNGEAWASVFKTFDAFNLLYGAARLGQGISVAATEVASKRALFHHAKQTEDWARYPPSVQNTIKHQLDEMQKAMDELDHMVSKTTLQQPTVENQDDIWNWFAEIGDAGDLNSVSAQLTNKNIDEIVSNGLLAGWTKTKVLVHGKGNYPAPTKYLSKEYISNHLKEFEKNVSFFCPKKVIDVFGELLGRSDGVYVMPAQKMDELIAYTGGDLTKIEIELGIPKGRWSSVPMRRVDVESTEGLNLRMPTGNEEAANDLFVPGGFTIKGRMEAVINPIPRKRYTFDIINK